MVATETIERMGEYFQKMSENKDALLLLEKLTREAYDEYIMVCNNFQNELDELKNEVISNEETEEALQNFYVEKNIEEETINNFVESYRKEVGEKYSKFVIEHLNDTDENTKTNTNQIVRLTPDLLNELLPKVEGQANLELNGLEVLDEDTATELVKHEREELHLDGLKNLDPSVAPILSGFKGNTLSLNGLGTFNEGVENLKGFKGEKLYLKGITSLTTDNVENIKEFEVKSISLGEITEEEIIKALGNIEGKEIDIEGVVKEEDEGQDEKEEVDEDNDENKEEGKDEEEKDEGENPEESTGKKALNWIENKCDKIKTWWQDKFKPWFNNLSIVKSIKEDLAKENTTFIEWLWKKIIK